MAGEQGFRVSFVATLLGVKEEPPKGNNTGGFVNVNVADDDGGTIQFFTFSDDETVMKSVRSLSRLDRIRGEATVKGGQYGKISARLLVVEKDAPAAAPKAVSAAS